VENSVIFPNADLKFYITASLKEEPLAF
jgi:Cytidylate kinase